MTSRREDDALIASELQFRSDGFVLSIKMRREEEARIVRQVHSPGLMPEIQRNDQPALAVPALEPEDVAHDRSRHIIPDAEREVRAP
jgi:hypothetical protein